MHYMWRSVVFRSYTCPVNGVRSDISVKLYVACWRVAIVLMTPMDVVEDILLSASRLGLTDGQRAFIHIDTITSLNASSQLAMTVPFISQSAGNSSNSDLLTTAAQTLLIIKAHAVSVTNVSATYKVSLSACFHCSYCEFFHNSECKAKSRAVYQPLRAVCGLPFTAS